MTDQDRDLRNEILRCWGKFGFLKGSEVFALHQWINLPENREKSQRQHNKELLSIKKLSKAKSTLDKTFADHNKIRFDLIPPSKKVQIEIFASKLLDSFDEEEDEESERLKDLMIWLRKAIIRFKQYFVGHIKFVKSHS